MVKIICLGDYTGGVGTKLVLLINDYMEDNPPVKAHWRPPKFGNNIRLKTIRWKKGKYYEPITIRLQLWDIGEYERFTTMTRVYFRNSQEALVF